MTRSFGPLVRLSTAIFSILVPVIGSRGDPMACFNRVNATWE